MEWHNISDPASPELDRLAERYRLHPLHIEDCRHRNQSAKIEEGQSYLFTVMKVIRFDPQGELEIADLDIFLGQDYIITVIETDCPETEGLIARAQKATDQSDRADQKYYRLIDEIVDSYLPITDKLSETLDHLEDEALADPTPQTLSTIF